MDFKQYQHFSYHKSTHAESISRGIFASSWASLAWLNPVTIYTSCTQSEVTSVRFHPSRSIRSVRRPPLSTFFDENDHPAVDICSSVGRLVCAFYDRRALPFCFLSVCVPSWQDWIKPGAQWLLRVLLFSPELFGWLQAWSSSQDSESLGTKTMNQCDFLL